jgi:hypothetical protein
VRTTLTIDDDVLFALKERARRERRTVGEVLSELVRQALTGRAATAPQPSDSFFGFRPLPHRGRTVSNELIDRLREEEAV